MIVNERCSDEERTPREGVRERAIAGGLRGKEKVASELGIKWRRGVGRVLGQGKRKGGRVRGRACDRKWTRMGGYRESRLFCEWSTHSEPVVPCTVQPTDELARICIRLKSVSRVHRPESMHLRPPIAPSRPIDSSTISRHSSSSHFGKTVREQRELDTWSM